MGENQPLTLRCSGLPLLMKCASSQEKTPHPVHDTDTPPQNAGNASHALLARHVVGQEADDHNISEASTQHHADAKDVSMLYAMGRKAWRELEPYFRGSEIMADDARAFEATSETTPAFRLTGHPDVSGEDCGVDWKSGRIQSDSYWQLQGYAWLFGWSHAATVWLRFSEIEIEAYMGDEAFEKSVSDQIARIGKEYSPGDHCGLCKKQDDCPARAKRLQTARAVVGGGEYLPANREALATVYPMAAQLSKALAEYYDAVNATIREHGPLPLEGGREAYITEFDTKEIDPVKGWPVLSKRYSDTQIAKIVSIGNGKMEEMVKDEVREQHNGKPPRGSLGRTVAEVWDELREAGAVSTSPGAQRRVRKVK
jgi:hypothetical protein